jgi:hypothetical protein
MTTANNSGKHENQINDDDTEPQTPHNNQISNDDGNNTQKENKINVDDGTLINLSSDHYINSSSWARATWQDLNHSATIKQCKKMTANRNRRQTNQQSKSTKNKNTEKQSTKDNITSRKEDMNFF